MNNLKTDEYYIDKILTDLYFIREHMQGQSLKTIGENEILLDSMLFRLIQIQENAKRLTDEYKNENGDIPWTDISGLRNRIVHDYGNVDLEVIYDTLTNDIPWLINKLEKSERKVKIWNT